MERERIFFKHILPLKFPPTKYTAKVTTTWHKAYTNFFFFRKPHKQLVKKLNWQICHHSPCAISTPTHPGLKKGVFLMGENWELLKIPMFSICYVNVNVPWIQKSNTKTWVFLSVSTDKNTIIFFKLHQYWFSKKPHKNVGIFISENCRKYNRFQFALSLTWQKYHRFLLATSISPFKKPHKNMGILISENYQYELDQSHRTLDFKNAIQKHEWISNIRMTSHVQMSLQWLKSTKSTKNVFHRFFDCFSILSKIWSSENNHDLNAFPTQCRNLLFWISSTPFSQNVLWRNLAITMFRVESTLTFKLRVRKEFIHV